nr:MAG TPA: hypothetical protein [Caudoviricetes sp.]
MGFCYLNDNIHLHSIPVSILQYKLQNYCIANLEYELNYLEENSSIPSNSARD